MKKGLDATDCHQAIALRHKVRRSAHLISGTDSYGPICDLDSIDAIRLIEEQIIARSHHVVKERQCSRLPDWHDRVLGSWKATCAKAFVKYIRNDTKQPLASFPDPDQNFKPSANPRRSDEFLRRAWSLVFHGQDEELVADWDAFR